MDGVLYLTGRDIDALGVSPGRLRAALARAFRLHAEGRTHVEPKLTVAIAPGHFFQSLCAACGGWSAIREARLRPKG